MNKNIKNALLLGTVVALTGSSWAGDEPFRHEGPKMQKFGGADVQYTEKEDGEIERSPSSLGGEFDSSGYSKQEDLDAARNQFIERMGPVIGEYDKTIEHTNAMREELKSRKPDKSKDEFKPKQVDRSVLNDWVEDGNTDDSQTITKGKNKNKTWKYMRDLDAQLTRAQDIENEKAEERYNQAMAAHTKLDKNLEQVAKLEGQKKDEKKDFVEKAKSATLQTPWQAFVNTLEQEGDRELFGMLGDGSPKEAFDAVKKMHTKMEQLEERTKQSEQSLHALQQSRNDFDEQLRELEEEVEAGKKNIASQDELRNKILDALCQFKPVAQKLKEKQIKRTSLDSIINFVKAQMPEWNKMYEEGEKAKGGNGQVPAQPKPAAGGNGKPADDVAPAPAAAPEAAPKGAERTENGKWRYKGDLYEADTWK